MPRRVRLRLLLLALLAAVSGVLALAGVASADLLTPEDGGSSNADDIDGLYKLAFALGVVVFVGVEGALIYSLIKFRARRGAVPAQIRGNTRLEIGWTTGAALVLLVLAAVTFGQLDDIRDAPRSSPNGLALASTEFPDVGEGDVQIGDRSNPPDGKSLKIIVRGEQYLWSYIYPDGDSDRRNNVRTYEELVVPTDTTVSLMIGAEEVIHSWWIPELGGKFDAVPGHTNFTWFKIPGELAGKRFRGQCAELCGRNHANMVAHVRAVTPTEYEAFIAAKQREMTESVEGVRAYREKIAAERSETP